MTFTYTQKFTSPWGTLEDAGKSFTGSTAIVTDETLLDNDTDTLSIAFDQAAFQCMAILSNSTVTSIGGNGSNPDSAFTTALVAGQMKFYSVISDNVVDMTYVTPVIGSGGTLNIRVLYDSTP